MGFLHSKTTAGRNRKVPALLGVYMIRTDLFIGYQAGIYFEADIVFLFFFLFFYRMPSYTTTCVEKDVSHIYWKFSIMSSSVW